MSNIRVIDEITFALTENFGLNSSLKKVKVREAQKADLWR